MDIDAPDSLFNTRSIFITYNEAIKAQIDFLNVCMNNMMLFEEIHNITSLLALYEATFDIEL